MTRHLKSWPFVHHMHCCDLKYKLQTLLHAIWTLNCMCDQMCAFSTLHAKKKVCRVFIAQQYH